MSGNRFRAQFPSIGFDFGDPLLLSASLAGAAAISTLQFADDHVLKSDSHPVVDDAQSAHPFAANLDHTLPVPSENLTGPGFAVAERIGP
jgi:hypothetical protein